jgi:ribose-phosphate pyrophosphokinase
VESLVRALAPLEPAEVNIIAVHAIFSPPAAERLKLLVDEKLLNKIIVTDTVYCPDCVAGKGSGGKEMSIPNLEVVPSAELSARVISTITTNKPLSKLHQAFDAAIYLNSPNLFNQKAPG